MKHSRASLAKSSPQRTQKDAEERRKPKQNQSQIVTAKGATDAKEKTGKKSSKDFVPALPLRRRALVVNYFCFGFSCASLRISAPSAVKIFVGQNENVSGLSAEC